MFFAAAPERDKRGLLRGHRTVASAAASERALGSLRSNSSARVARAVIFVRVRLCDVAVRRVVHLSQKPTYCVIRNQETLLSF